MNLGKNARKRLVTVASLLAPVVMVQMVRWVFDAPSSPAGASASTPAVGDPTPPQDPAPKLSKDQLAIAEWVRGVRITSDLRSPMDHGEPKPAIAPVTPGPTAPVVSVPEVDPTAKLTVGAIFGGKSGQMATINGRVFGIGDEVAPGWRVARIDPRSGTVQLSGPSDKSVDLRVQPKDHK